MIVTVRPFADCVLDFVEADVTGWRRPAGLDRVRRRRLLTRKPRVLAVPVMLALVAALVSGLPGGAVVPAAATPRASRPAVQAGESAALKRARSTGSQVEVGALRGESREVYAQPDGTFEAVEHLRPVRTRQDGKWVDIDTALRKRADGTVSPAAAAVGLAFSGGGTGPMATMVKAGRKLSFSWPGTLPAPALSGATATYTDVIAGVDLQLNADADGFSDVLVVKTRQAATGPGTRPAEVHHRHHRPAPHRGQRGWPAGHRPRGRWRGVRGTAAGHVGFSDRPGHHPGDQAEGGQGGDR